MLDKLDDEKLEIISDYKEKLKISEYYKNE